MPRAVLIVLLIVGGVLVAGLIAAAFVVAAGSGDDSSEADVTVSFDGAQRQLQLPLATERGVLTLARRNGRVLVGLALDPSERMQVAVVEGEQAVPESDLTFTVDGRLITPTACGHACWELDVRQARELVVNAPETLRFELPAVLPPAGAAAFAAVERTMGSLRTYRYEEELTSGAGPGTTSTWEAQAPDRLRVRGRGFRSVIVGRSRWDFRGGRWERSPFPGLELPSYMWDGAANPRILGRGGGRRVLSVFDREPIPAWFRLTIDPQNRVLDAEMLAPSHFMRQRFRGFDAPLTIRPPQ